jgi:hypothetical protein
MIKVVKVQRKRFKQDDSGKYIPYIQSKLVRVYGHSDNEIKIAHGVKQKLYEKGLL